MISADYLLELMKDKELIIFGTGYVAERFFLALEAHGLSNQIRCFTVTCAPEDGLFHGKPIISFSGSPVPENALICLAVHDSLRQELYGMFPVLKDHAVWIYPYLTDLLYGESLGTKEISLRELFGMQDRSANWIAVRYAAVRDFLSQSASYEKTRNLYIHAISLHCSVGTAERRCRKLEELALSIKMNGYYPDCPIFTDGSLRIIDGLHRIACCAFLDIPVIPARIYPISDVYDRLLGESNRLPEKLLLKAGFTADEMIILRNARKEICKKWLNSNHTGSG